MNAIEKVTLAINYPRPHYVFPDLNGEQGNPIFYWKEAIKTIEKSGFKKEAQDIEKYFSKKVGYLLVPQLSYEDQFNFLARFLDFSIKKNEKISEDDDYIYIKIKKDMHSIADVKQPLILTINNQETLQDLIDNNEDVSIKNCYGRNILHYLTNPVTLKFLLDINIKKNLFDLFELDNFNSTLLQTHNKFNTFTIILEAMYNENPTLTSQYFIQTNSFNTNASGVYLAMIDCLFNIKQNHELNVTYFEDFVNSLKIIKLVNPIMHEDILETIKIHPIMQNQNSDEKNSTFIMIQYLLIESTLEIKNSTNHKKLKI
jgi:hypothetical protein